MKTSQILLTIVIFIAFLAGCSGSGGNNSVDNTDTTAPIRSNSKPYGALAQGTTTATLSLLTNEDATCRYSTTPNQSFDVMSNTFSTTEGKNHAQDISGLIDGTVYAYYVKCKDSSDNKNSDDFVISFSVGSTGDTISGGFTVGHTNTALSDIPDTWITQAKSNLHIAYNHTSHGSQLITGMNALEEFPSFGNKYAWSDTSQGNAHSLSLDDMGISGTPDLSQGDGDSDSDGVANWAEDTYDFLNDPNNNHINVIMWSWCNIGGHDIDLYLSSMEWLIGQFSKGGSHARGSKPTL